MFQADGQAPNRCAAGLLGYLERYIVARTYCRIATFVSISGRWMSAISS